MTDIEQYAHIQEIAEELQEYADLDGTEIGEMCGGLIYLTNYVDYISPEFYAILIKEIEDQLTDFKENTVIEEHEETIPRKVKSLEWIG